MPIENPNQLVNEFKNSGEFDRLRRELLTQFLSSDEISSFKSKIEEHARDRLKEDQKLQFMPSELIQRELLQEMDRYPTVERAVADMRMLSDPSFAVNIRSSIQKIFRKDKTQRAKHSKAENVSEGKRVITAEASGIQTQKLKEDVKQASAPQDSGSLVTDAQTLSDSTIQLPHTSTAALQTSRGANNITAGTHEAEMMTETSRSTDLPTQ